MAEALRGQALLGGLVVAHARVVARPPIEAPGGKCLPAKPPAIAAIGVVVGAIDPDPHAIPEDPVTEAVMVVVVIVALGKATIAVAVVTVTVEGLGVSTTHVALRARAIEIAVRVSGAAIHATAIVAGAAPADEVATADVRSAAHLWTAAAAKPTASTTGEGLAAATTSAAVAAATAATAAAATSATAKSA